jgi:hypothetical protein
VTHPYKVEMSLSNAKSKALLTGLYIGLLLLLGVSHLDANRRSGLHLATNIYGIQALAGAILGFWRVRNHPDNSKPLLDLPSVWICFGLLGWVIGQILWVAISLQWDAGTLKVHPDPPYPSKADIFYIISVLCWLVALLKTFKLLRRRALTETSRFMAIVTAVLGLLVSLFLFLNSSRLKLGELDSNLVLLLACDFVTIIVTSLSLVLAVALLLGENAEIPLPVHQCIRYLCLATAADAAATLAFTVTIKLTDGSLVYFNGNWVDGLFLTAMYFWGISAIKCPLRDEELSYTSGTRLSGMKVEDIYQAGEIAKSYARTAEGAEQITLNSDSIRWIMDTIPKCLRVVKLGDLVVGSTFVFPVSQSRMDSFCKGELTERRMFEEVQNDAITWDCLYLADASILTNHRRRRLAFNSFIKSIESIAEEHTGSQLRVYCWPTTLERKLLAEKLRSHFEKTNIRVIPKE